MYNLVHKEQLHVSALFIGHLQVDKWETLSHLLSWRWPMKRAETCSCSLCNKLYISVPPYSCVRQVYKLQSSLIWCFYICMKTVEPFQFSFSFNSFNSHVTWRSTYVSAHMSRCISAVCKCVFITCLHVFVCVCVFVCMCCPHKVLDVDMMVKMKAKYEFLVWMYRDMWLVF